jgi:hypothetical protein
LIRILNHRYIFLKNRISFAVLLTLVLLITQSGCSILRFNNPEKKAQKQMEKKEKEQKKAYRADVKNQYKMQTKETRKRMNKNLRKVNRDYKKKTGKSKLKCTS